MADQFFTVGGDSSRRLPENLDISTDGRALVIVPSQKRRRSKRFQNALADCNVRYGKALKRLAE